MADEKEQADGYAHLVSFFRHLQVNDPQRPIEMEFLKYADEDGGSLRTYVSHTWEEERLDEIYRQTPEKLPKWNVTEEQLKATEEWKKSPPTTPHPKGLIIRSFFAFDISSKEAAELGVA